MTELFPESQRNQIQAVIAWGSISYSLGFLTVLAHTHRLGIPVVEVVKPIYIWIGIPLTLIVYLSRWYGDYFKKRFTELQLEFSEISQGFLSKSSAANQTKNQEREVDFLEDSVAVIFSSPFFLLVSSERKSSIYKGVLSRWLEISGEDKPLSVRDALVWNLLETMKQLPRLWTFSRKIRSFLTIVLIVPALIYTYVAYIYPEIPYSLGGGKPASVSFALQEDIPGELFELLFGEECQVKKQFEEEPIRLSPTVKLLITSADQYFFQIENKSVISVDKEIVRYIVWNPSGDTD